MRTPQQCPEEVARNERGFEQQAPEGRGALNPCGEVTASTCRLTVKLRGRTTTPDKRRGRTLSPSARGAEPLAHHGPLQRLLDGTINPGSHKSLHLRMIAAAAGTAKIKRKIGSSSAKL